MLNQNNERELAYLVNIDAIEPIEGSDNCEAAVVGGWRIMVRKGTFEPKDIAIYFEIDSQVPSTSIFAFLEKKHYKIKTQKYTFGGKGNFVSQGLLMSPKDFGWETVKNPYSDNVETIIDGSGDAHHINDESKFLTKLLGVTYASSEDNYRKGKSLDKYAKMAQRHQKLFGKQPFKWLMSKKWGRKILFFYFGKKKDKRTWPAWVQKTDEERIENLPFMLLNKNPFIATEKIDGTSTTFTMKRKRFGKNEFYVCSRNVVFDKPDKKCYYPTNVYTEMAEKYDIENVLNKILEENPKYDWVTLQGETFGGGIQKRDYNMDEHQFRGFNFITSEDGRWNSIAALKYMEKFNIPWVPIIDENYILPDTVEELREFSHSEGSHIDGEIKEGIVFRSLDGKISFKCVDPEFLIKYHS